MDTESLKICLESFPPFETENVQVTNILEGRGWLLKNFMTKDECKALIAESERRGYDFKASGNRYCHRTLTNDVPMATWMWERVKHFVPAEYVDENMRKWIVQNINPNLRNCKYVAGNYFGPPNVDFCNYVGKQKSWYTIMIYLNSSQDGEFKGVIKNKKTENVPTYTLEPTTGTAIVFLQEDDSLLHEGALIESGTKSDVMYLKEKNLIEQ